MNCVFGYIMLTYGYFAPCATTPTYYCIVCVPAGLIIDILRYIIIEWNYVVLIAVICHNVE